MSVVYLDNNASALMPQAAVEALASWCNRGSPAAAHAGARESRAMLDAFRREIAAECGFDLADYAVVFTSGASESNCAIATGAVRAYAVATKRLPHVIASAADHASLLGCCRRLAADGLCRLTVLSPARAGPGRGTVDPADLAAALRPNTCLVSVVAADGNTGALNDLRALGKLTRAARVPLHTDAAQLFGRSAIRPGALGVDAFSASFHKLGGPPGVGILVLRRDLVAGYGLAPLIAGQQNGGLRGGTENLPGLGASFAAFRLAMADRGGKNARVLRARNALKAAIAARLPCFDLDDHPGDPPPSIDGGITPGGARREGSAAARRAIAGDRPAVFWLTAGDDRRVLPNTLLLAVRRPGFSGGEARAALEERGVIVGLPIPDILAAMGVPAVLRAGALRVSLGDTTTADEISTFVRHFLAVVD